MPNFNPFNAPKSNNGKNIDKLASIIRISLLIPEKLSKKVNKITKYFKKNDQSKKKTNGQLKGKIRLYAQVTSLSSNNTKEVLKIKEIFPNLQVNKIKNIQRIIKGDGKPKFKLNMTTKGPLRKQIIIPMNINNRNKFVAEVSAHISNISKVLKNIKLDVKADFIQSEQAGIVIATNKVTFLLDLQTMENYIKNSNQIKVNNVKPLCLPQPKLYLKIIGLLYFMENINLLLFSDMVETIIKNNHIFNNMLGVVHTRIESS